MAVHLSMVGREYIKIELYNAPTVNNVAFFQL